MAVHYTMKSGQSIILNVPCDHEQGFGEYPSTQANRTKGWSMKTAAAGTLVEASASEIDGRGCAVKYTHSSSTAGNTLTFTAADGRQEHVFISVPTGVIHDHSTLTQGGPAYGTYASLLDAEE